MRTWQGPWRLNHQTHQWYRAYTTLYPGGLISSSCGISIGYITSTLWGPRVPERAMAPSPRGVNQPTTKGATE